MEETRLALRTQVFQKWKHDFYLRSHFKRPTSLTVGGTLKGFALALWVLYALLLADIVTSIIVLSHGTVADLNPLYYAQGFRNFLIAKLGFSPSSITIYSGTYVYVKAKQPNNVKALWSIVLFLIGMYLLIVGNNVIVLFHALS